MTTFYIGILLDEEPAPTKLFLDSTECELECLKTTDDYVVISFEIEDFVPKLSLTLH